MKVGSIGSVVFEVNSENAAILKDYQRTVKANYSTHSLVGQTAIMEYTGTNPTEISFSLTLSAFLGLNPGEQLAKIEEMAKLGQKVVLSIGTLVVGEKWAVTDVSSKAERHFRDGDVLAYDVSIKLKECVTPRINTDTSGYYLAESETGWQKRSGFWYYYENGIMQTGWKLVGGAWYYMNESGIMQTGWLLYQNIWYYLNPSGDMATEWVKVDGVWYYMNESGAMQTGWIQWKGDWYYCQSNGAMVTGTQVINGKTYYFDDSGKCTNPYD